MRHSERGNAVIFILLAIALFAGLAYTFMRGAQTGQGNLTSGQAKIVAQEIISDAASIERAINKLRTRGCSENDINFAGPNNGSPVNANAPTDGSCDMYNASGAGLTFNAFEGHVVGALPSGEVNVVDTNTTAGDLIYFYLGPNNQLCSEINKQLGIENSGTIPVDNTPINGSGYLGTYAAAGTADGPIHASDPRLEHHPDACVYYSADDMNVFVKLLINR